MRCPLCGSEQYKHLGAVRCTEGFSFIRPEWCPFFITMYQCEKCDAVFGGKELDTLERKA